MVNKRYIYIIIYIYIYIYIIYIYIYIYIYIIIIIIIINTVFIRRQYVVYVGKSHNRTAGTDLARRRDVSDLCDIYERGSITKCDVPNWCAITGQYWGMHPETVACLSLFLKAGRAGMDDT